MTESSGVFDGWMLNPFPNRNMVIVPKMLMQQTQ